MSFLKSNTFFAINDSLIQDPTLEDKLTVSHIYKLTKRQLQSLFTSHKNKDELKSFGSVKGVVQKLASDQNSGIIGDDKDILRRKKQFGINKKPLPPQPRLIDSFKEVLQDKTWWAVFGTALLSSIGQAIGDQSIYGFIPGLSIMIVGCFIITITVFADWFKDKKFVQLQSLVKEEQIAVIRGKFGSTQSISVWDLVVGDVIILNQGQRIPADCLVIESQDLKVDESTLHQNEEDNVESKSINKSSDEHRNGDPFLKAGSIVVKGIGKVLVCAVGENSTLGIVEKKLDTESDTKLQKKLKNLSEHLTFLALVSGLIIFLELIISLFIKMGFSSESALSALLKDLPKTINLIVVLVIVAIPEGLPLTIGVSLAFSVLRMYNNDKILVKNLQAPETMGEIEEICCGKTGTITQNNMKVKSFICENKNIKNQRKNTLMNCELSMESINRIKDSILYNCEARVEMDATNYVPVGDGTEVALLKFLQDAEFPIHSLIQRKFGKIRAVFPFNAEKKYSAIALENPENSESVSIYIKGAPEQILKMCKCIQTNKGISNLQKLENNQILQEISKIASQPQRVLAFAFSEISKDIWNQQIEEAGVNFEQAIDEEKFNFVFLAAIGLKDPLRNKVRSAIKYATEQGKLQIRMVSGDHIETAQAVALKAGIISQEDLGRSYTVMTGEDFREQVGQLILRRNEQDEDYLGLENQDAFYEISQELKVLARATSNDKHLLVIGLKNLGRKVSVTGDGINDIEALNASDVGLGMGSGCSAVKAASDLILTNDDFEACLKAIMWGRNIYHNVSRFLQFQLTVNISCILVVFIGILFFSESPLTATQLFWVNLIMDTFAALALATEPPLPSVIKGSFKDQQVLTKVIWRQIIGISLWNVLIITFLIFPGNYLIGLPYYNRNANTMQVDECIKYGQTSEKCQLYIDGQNKLKHYTYIFNVFVFLQIFNEINCRKIGVQDFNVFDKFFHNFYFLTIVIGTFSLQIIINQYWYYFTDQTKLTKSEWGACIVAGSSPLLISLILKVTPARWVELVPTSKFVNEDHSPKDNKVLSAWNKLNADKSEKEIINQNQVSKGDDFVKL